MGAPENRGKIDIAIGKSRKAVHWLNKQLTWAEFVERLKTPIRTQETVAEYGAMKKSERDEVKDVGGFVGGCLKGGRRKADTVAWRSLLTLDMDDISSGQDPWAALELAYDCAAVIYSTHSSTAVNPRYRLIIPLSRKVTADEYVAIARRVAADIGIDMCDDTTYEQHRLMYWPSCSYDADYIFHSQDGPWLDADEQLARYTDWHDPAQWPQSSHKRKQLHDMAKRQGEPTEKPGLIGAFCRVYDIESAIDAFLPEVYVKISDDRYTYAKGSTAGGLVLYENGKFAYSHHGTDPAGGKLCNAYDLVRIHKFGRLDDDEPEQTPVTRLPSSKAMQDMLADDKAVMTELFMSAPGHDSGSEDDKAWLSGLAITKVGTAENTIDNIMVILQNDSRLKGQFGYDVFHQKPFVLGDLPWQAYENRDSKVWTDSDDAGLRYYLEKCYGIDHIKKTQEALELIMQKNKFHPVRAYLEGLEWDGISRVDSFFIDTLGAEDTAYTKAVTRKALVGAVARIMEPGCKHDHMLVLVGPQGSGKSSTLMRLGGPWFSDSLFTVNGKDAFEQLQGAWIIEMSEMAATRKAEIEQIKLFISKQVDSFRAAYARRTIDYPRQCAFFGTTNDEVFMKDQTGGRRFWPIKVIGLLDDSPDTDQVWAEALTAYKAGETWHLNAAEEKAARLRQKEFTEVDERLGLIEKMLDIPIPVNWADMAIYDRQAYYRGDVFSTGTEKREAISAIEVWSEFFGRDPASYSLKDAREINAMLRQLPDWRESAKGLRLPIYGRQRVFTRRK